MSKNQVIFNQIGVFCGTTCSTGLHFIDSSGNLTNSQYNIVSGFVTGYSTNTVKSLNRVISSSYSFSDNRTDVKSMGNFGTLARPILSTPPISLNLSYYQFGLYNENILGFNLSNGITPIYNFYNRTGTLDSKNIFIATNDNYDDLNFINPSIQILNGTTGNILKDNIHVYSFGDCYLDSYKVSASIGNIPQSDITFTAQNLIYYSGGSGHNIPSVNPKDLTLRSGIVYNLPPFYTGRQSSVLLPGDITLNISEVYGNTTLNNLAVDFNDIKIQSFSIDLSLNREPLNNLGYRIPLDRRVNLPAYANLSLSAIVGNSETGSFIDFINKDTNYNVSINMNYSNYQPFTGLGINYKFLSSKFNNISISESINEKRMVQLSITSELYPNNNNIGFFISGQLGV